jgi:thiamine-phosphate pyrophosphorylase
VHAIVADIETARRAVAAGATVVQLRIKGPTRAIVERGAGFADLGATFVVNDDVHAAVALGADGVHLGQQDYGERVPGLILGRSVSTVAEALAADADYLGAGPVWSTPSKMDAEPPIGLEGLRRICAAVDIPVVAIGGVDATNAAACIEAGATGVAVIRAATDPALRRAVDEALGDR